MMMNWMQSRRMTFFLRMVLFFLVCCLIHRLAFMFYFYPSSASGASSVSSILDWRNLLRSFGVGLRFDLRLVLAINLPFLILTAIPFFDPHSWKGAKFWWKFYFIIIFIALQFIYAFDYGHYSYLNSRLNASILSLVDASNWQISAKMIWESYPLLWIFLCLGLLIYAAKIIMSACVFSVYAKPSESLVRTWGKAFMTWLVVFLLSAWGLWGSSSLFPLRWSDAFFSTNNYLSNAALNPAWSLIESLKFKNQSVDVNLLRNYYDVVAEHLGVPLIERDALKLNFNRKVEASASPRLPNKPNVVILLVESMSSFMTGDYGNPLGDRSTPFLNEIIPKSLYFPNFMVPAQATARSVFGLVTGTPDVSDFKTSSGNPMIVSQHTLINDMTGYKKFYFLGGSASWGNIRGLFSHNVDGIDILEEDRFSAGRSDVWGISDYQLAEIADEKFKNTKSPFFAIFQTSGFHRPYTIPDEHGDFKKIEESEISLKELNEAGFDDLNQFNSIRFQDYSLRHFFELAQKSPYFENTLFILLGDHGLPMKSAKHVPATDAVIDLPCFHVPLVMYAPKLIQPERNLKVVSQLDLMPTILSMLGFPYTNTTLGRDIFDPAFDDKRSNFMYYWYYTPPRFVILNKDAYYLGGLESTHNKDDPSYFPWNEDKALRASTYPAPVVGLPVHANEKSEAAAKLARGLYLTARYLLSHNHP